jgi:hypothetical protein
MCRNVTLIYLEFPKYFTASVINRTKRNVTLIYFHIIYQPDVVFVINGNRVWALEFMVRLRVRVRVTQSVGLRVHGRSKYFKVFVSGHGNRGI